MDARGIKKVRALSREAGVSYATLSKILYNEHLQSLDSTLEPLAKYFKVTLGQLRGYEPIPGVTSPGEIPKDGIPLLRDTQIGKWLTYRLPEEAIDERVEVSYPKLSAEAFVYEVNDAAIPDIASVGETLIVDPAASGNENNVCLIMRNGRCAFRYMEDDLGQTVFTSPNPSFSTVAAEDCEFLGFIAGKPERTYQPVYEDEKLKRTNPDLFSDEAVELDLFSECGKHLDEFYGRAVSKSERLVLQGDLYKYCAQNGITAKALRSGSTRKALSSQYPDKKD